MGKFGELVTILLTVILVVVLLWFTYTIANIIVTVIKTKKQDKTLKFCFNTLGKVFYGILTLVFIIIYFGGLYYMIVSLLKGDDLTARTALNSAAFISVVYGYLISSVVLVGKKSIMVGRLIIDYRKLKKVSFTYNHKMTFVYGQRDYSISTRFVEVTEMRKRISK